MKLVGNGRKWATTAPEGWVRLADLPGSREHAKKRAVRINARMVQVAPHGAWHIHPEDAETVTATYRPPTGPWGNHADLAEEWHHMMHFFRDKAKAADRLAKAWGTTSQTVLNHVQGLDMVVAA